MRTSCLLAFLLITALFSVKTYAQTNFGFTYDASGNRVNRAVIVLKSATFQPDSIKSNQMIEPIDDQIGMQKTLIYPNPTKGMIRIELPFLKNQTGTIKLYDQTGRLVLNKEVMAVGIELDLSAFPSGMYIMGINIGQQKKEWKIIKD